MSGRVVRCGRKTARIAGYSVGACFDGASTAMVAIYGNPFLLSVAGIAPYHASVLQLAVRVVSAANDPVIGYLSDNVATRSGGLGRRRMLIALALVPLTVFFVLLWRVPLLDSEPRRAMYYLGLYFLYDVAATFVKVNYECLTSEMTYHEHERTAIVAGRHLAWVASASAAAMGLSTALAVTVTGPAAAIAIKQQYIFAGMGIVLIGAVMLLPTIAFAVERREWKTIWDDVLWLARFGGARWDPPQTELHPVRDVYVIDDAATAKGGARDGAGASDGGLGGGAGGEDPQDDDYDSAGLMPANTPIVAVRTGETGTWGATRYFLSCMWRDYTYMVRHRRFVMLQGAHSLLSAGTAAMTGVMLYYAQFVARIPFDQAVGEMLAGVVGALACSILLGLYPQHNKVVLLMISMTTWVGVSATLFVMGHRPGLLVAVGACVAASSLFLQSILPDVIDEGAELHRRGMRRDATYYAFNAVASNLGSGVGLFAVDTALARAGFAAGSAVQGAEAEAAIAGSFALVPVLCVLLAALPVLYLRADSRPASARRQPQYDDQTLDI